MTAAQVYDKVNDSIVGITVYNTAGNGSQASGVFYSEDGYIVTNDHIYSEVPAAKFKVYTSDGKQYDAKYVAGDKISDLAILQNRRRQLLPPAVFGDSEQNSLRRKRCGNRPSERRHRSLKHNQGHNIPRLQEGLKPQQATLQSLSRPTAP